MQAARGAMVASRVKRRQRLIQTAMGQIKAELVLKNATYVNVFTQNLCQGDIAITEGRIAGIGNYQGEQELDMTGKILIPGLIDSHIHLESSLTAPVSFARAVIPHGTTTVVTDPHEITNVMGTDGVRYMLEATEGLPLDVLFMLPSCVPATPLDESGAALGWQDMDCFYEHPRVLGLAEMMNFVGVVQGDEAVLAKLEAAESCGKRRDGHAPGLAGATLNGYLCAGIGSDHECSVLQEGLDKLALGQYIMIREGTAACNLEALAPLLAPRTEARCLLCTDDKHPNDLLEEGHMDAILRKAVGACGVDPVIAVKAATLNSATYFRLEGRGAIAPGYWADLVAVEDLNQFSVCQVWKNGICTYENGTVQAFPSPVISSDLAEKAQDTFHVAPLSAESFSTEQELGVIGMVPGQIISTDNGLATGIDLAQDILKIAVIERHHNTGHIGLGYLQGYGLKRGAVATSVAHDSHNIIVVGTDEEEMAAAANQIIAQRGGIAVMEKGVPVAEVPLEIGGLMSDLPLEEMNTRLEFAKSCARERGVHAGIDPFMTLSFMSLPVIPTLRLTTKGLVRV